MDSTRLAHLALWVVPYLDALDLKVSVIETIGTPLVITYPLALAVRTCIVAVRKSRHIRSVRARFDLPFRG